MSIALSLSDCLGPKKGISILVWVAKLLCLSIDASTEASSELCYVSLYKIDPDKNKIALNNT